MAKYPYKYQSAPHMTRVVADPEILCQILAICHDLYGKNLTSKGIFAGHWWVQFQHPDGYFSDESKTFPHKTMAHEVMTAWRKKHDAKRA